MKEQTSIPKHKLSRAASLIGAGAQIGLNYARFNVEKSLSGKDATAVAKAKLRRDSANAEVTFDAFSRLKGSPLKMAQMLSMDKNILPAPYAEQFQKSYYSAPPLSYPLVVKTFKRETGRSPTEVFDEFSHKAVAGASIGQVHRARKDGQDYAVKVQYPGVADSLKSDLNLVKPFAMRLFNLDAKSLAPYLAEVEARLMEETDYALELRRAQELAAQSGQLRNTHFPKYYPELSGPRIITMDWIDGLTLDKWIATGPTQEERNRIGQAIWDFYHFQIHQLRCFHADPHPGNLFVKDGELWVIDFGCVKQLDDGFYRRFFSLMDQARTSDPVDFEKMLMDLDLLRPGDTPHMRRKLASVYYQSIELLARPFHNGTFDFGDEGYVREIFEFSEQTRADREMSQLTSSRGDANAIYLNRAYYGLYNLEASLAARVEVQVPEFIHAVHEPLAVAG